MAPDITESTEKGTRNRRMGSRLHRLWSRRVVLESSSPSLKSPDVVVVVETEKTKAVAVAVANGRDGASPSSRSDERKGSHEHGGDVRADDKTSKEDKVEGTDNAGDDAGDDAGMDTGNDTGNDSGRNFGDVTGNDTGDDSDSTNRVGASGQLPNFWEKAWNSDELGERGRILLQGNVMKSVGSGKKPPTVASRTISHKAVVEGVIKNTQERMVSYTVRWGSGDDNKTTLGVARSILLSAKEVLDSVVQFDPTSYSSAAWAVVSFSLTVRLIVLLMNLSILITSIGTVGSKRPGSDGSDF